MKRLFFRFLPVISFVLMFIIIHFGLRTTYKLPVNRGETRESSLSAPYLSRFNTSSKNQGCYCQTPPSMSPGADGGSEWNVSTCSGSGMKSGTNSSSRKVVAYSLYIPSGEEEEKRAERNILYSKGILMNIELIRKHLKGFVMRVYTNELPEYGFCEILCNNSDIQWCNISNTPSYGNLSQMFFMTWRFLPLGDPTVDVFLSRDLDSIISEREAAAVEDWLQLNKSFHVMRDRRVVHHASILGGLWGARNDLLGNRALEIQQKIISRGKEGSFQGYGSDQALIDVVVYRSHKADFVAYDSYHCDYYREETLVRPFPKQRANANDFAGNPVLGGGKWPAQECPEGCRPSYGKNWTYC